MEPPQPPPPVHPFSETPAPQPLPVPAHLRPANRRGRRTTLTPDLQARIVECVEVGNYLRTAAQSVGVGQSTLLGWLARGRQAAAAVAEHEQEPADAAYCPTCGLDRTGETRDLADRQDAVDADHAEEGEDAPRLTPNPCPSCGSSDQPAPWELPASEALYVDFLEEVTRAQTAAEVAAVRAWRSAFTDDWRAARDYLGRTSPERWAGVTRVQMTNEEAERRIDDAVTEALIAIGLDGTTAGDGDPLDPDGLP